MPMIGGELAAEAALDGNRIAADAHDLGWVSDWLYGGAALPPMPLPQRGSAHPRRAPVHAEAPLHADVPAPRPTPARRRARGRRSRQLALL
jgi:hypothetical protein